MMQNPWEWRKASGGWWHSNETGHYLFHAYDINDNSACEPNLGLGATVEQPNEGSRLCPACIDVVKALPAGRDKKVYAST